MEEIMKDVVAANPDWGCQLLRSAGQYLIEYEAKAKVVAAGWGDRIDSIPCRTRD